MTKLRPEANLANSDIYALAYPSVLGVETIFFRYSVSLLRFHLILGMLFLLKPCAQHADEKAAPDTLLADVLC